MPEWTVLQLLDDPEPDVVIGARAGDQALAAVWHDGRWRVFADRCTHAECAFTDYGEIETAEPGRELSFTHWSRTPEPPDSYNLVRYRITREGKGSRVRLAQFGRGKPHGFDDNAKAEFRKNWAMMLEGLKKASEG